jgi:uncharacterized protein (DUF983 family)
MASGEPQPQFRTAEYTPNASTMTCAVCRHPITGSYFKLKGAPVCAECTEKIRAQIPQDSHAAFVRAVMFGIGGALLGFALYVGFALETGLIIGWVSLAVGFIVGKAMHLGSGGVGGRRYQVVAVLLTYLAVSMSAVPIALQQNRHHQGEVQSAETTVQPSAHMNVGKAIGVLALIGIASPILELQDPVHGIIGLIILLVGIRFAWRFTADRTVNVSGPYTVATAGAA